MELKIYLCLEILIIDLLVWLLIKKICKLEVCVMGVCLSQICNIFAMLCFLFFNLAVIWLVLIKFIAAIFISLLIVNEYKTKEIFMLLGLFVLLSLSIFGYYKFLLLLFKSLSLTDLITKTYFNVVFAGCFLLFYVFIYLVSSFLLKNRSLQNFLAQVSFLLSGKHICLKGLIDSGNSVYDSESNLPVVLLSLDSLKRFIPLATMSYVSDILSKHCEKCVLVGGKNIFIPIVYVDNCKIEKDGKIKDTKFAVGIVKQHFFDTKQYDCLIHRDFV